MGPFPHDAEKSKITDENPAGTDGFEFVEFASADPQELRDLFTRMGYAHVANHKTQKIELCFCWVNLVPLLPIHLLKSEL